MNRLIRINEVMSLTGLKKSTIWAWIKDGKLPKGIKLSPRVTVWKLSDIEAFIEHAGESAA